MLKPNNDPHEPFEWISNSTKLSSKISTKYKMVPYENQLNVFFNMFCLQIIGYCHYTQKAILCRIAFCFISANSMDAGPNHTLSDIWGKGLNSSWREVTMLIVIMATIID